ncbi:MAG TPA: caspase family protein, partial [Pyrinomonadaceae bacterium]|nr:caspase family protein [Pyrinomonadaceae bacterium]
GTLIAYATAPGRVASDGPGRNGLYTSELLKQMRIPGLNLNEMFVRVRAEVLKQTDRKQVPWEASSLVGSFYFREPIANAEVSSTGPPYSGTKAADEQARPTTKEFIRKRGAKSGRVLYWPAISPDNHSDTEFRDFFLMTSEFDVPFIASLERAGLTMVRTAQLLSGEREQINRLRNALLRGERAQGRSFSTLVYLDVEISIKDMPQYAKLYIAMCRISLRLIDLEAGRVVANEQLKEAKGFGNDQAQARRNCLREASNLVPQTFIERVKESAW